MPSKSIEIRVRRAAARQGLTVIKSRTRNPIHPDYGTYGLVLVTAPGGPRSRLHIAGDSQAGFGLSLDDIEEVLAERVHIE